MRAIFAALVIGAALAFKRSFVSDDAFYFLAIAWLFVLGRGGIVDRTMPREGGSC